MIPYKMDVIIVNNKKLLFIYIFGFLFFELVFHIINFEKINYIYIILFTLSLALFLYTLINFFKPKIMKLITFILFIILTIYFVSQLIYFQIYHAIFSIEAITMTGQVTLFYDQIITVIFDNFAYIILL